MSMPEEEVKKGIINNAAKPMTLDKPASDYKAPEVKPVTTEIDPGQETVEARLNRLTTSGSPYIEQAKQAAIREANTRGLINTSMAAGSGAEAAIRQALPIAQQDAQTYADRSTLNQQSINEFLRNRQSANLNMETASHQTDLEIEKQRAITDFNIERDISNAQLNEQLAAFNSTLKQSEMKLDADLRLKTEQIMNDEKFSDEMKLQYVTTINNIVRDTQAQIVEIGLSDRSAAQQAEAIKLVEANRDASVKVYEDLLASSGDWSWSSNFTPDMSKVAESNNYWNTPGGIQPTSEPKVGTVVGDKIYRGNGVWDAVTSSAPATTTSPFTNPLTSFRYE